MNPDDLKQAWQAQADQTRLIVDTDRLFEEFRQSQQKFDATLIVRDLVEVGTAVILLPIWVAMGVLIKLPWTWYLTMPALVWIAGYMFVDLRRHRSRPDEASEPLRQRVESSLAQVNHQIWLLRNVQWWYLLPMFVPMMIFISDVAWRAGGGGLETVLVIVILGGIVAGIHTLIYFRNQSAVRLTLEPRRQELTTLLATLIDEAVP